MPTELPSRAATAQRLQARAEPSDTFFSVMCSSLVSLWIIGLFGVVHVFCGSYPIVVHTIGQSLFLPS